MNNEFKENNYNCKCDSDESIIALKVFDQCRIKDCIHQGPAISNEESVCVILQSNENERFGKVVLPGMPITIPDTARKAKIVSDSFQTEKTEITNITPAIGRKGFWDIEIKIVYIFKLRFYDLSKHVMKILHCDNDSHPSDDGSYITDYMKGSITYTLKVTLYGTQADTPQIASDLFPYILHPSENSPHVMVESKSYSMDAELKKPEDACHYQDVLDDNYDEPFLYAYITIGLFMIIRLFRFVNICIHSEGYAMAKPCEHCHTDPCDTLLNIDFPYQDFFPPDHLPKKEK